MEAPRVEMFSGSESLSLSFPPCTVGTVEAAHPPVAASEHSAQGRPGQRERPWQTQVQGPRPTPPLWTCTSLILGDENSDHVTGLH